MDRARILVLDEEASTLAGCRLALASAHDIETTSSGEADVVVCTLGSSGWEQQQSAARIVTYAPGEEGELGRTLREGAFYCLPRPVDAQVMRTVVARCLEATALLQRAQQQTQRLDGELDEARTLQRAMLPPAEGRLGKAGVSVAVRSRPCAEVGGDVVDYADAAGGRAALLIADVAGHGIGAAMLTTVVKSAFAASGPQFDPADVTLAVVAALRPFAPERFVTLIAARIDRASGKIEYVNAGHPAGWIFHRGKITAELNATIPLIMPGTAAGEIASVSMPLPDNSGLFLYTDGLTDAQSDGGGERFGGERIRDELERYPGGGAALLDGILGAVDAFTARKPQPDDLTLLTASIGLPGLA